MEIVFATSHVRRSRQAVPLAAACLAASLPMPERMAAALVDIFPDQSDAEALDAILAEKPHMVCFSVYTWNRQRTWALAWHIRNRSQQISLIAGGPEATADPQAFFRDAPFDGVVRGDGEAVFPALVEALNRGDDPVGLPGLIWGGVSGPSLDEEAPTLAPENLPSPWLSGVLPLTDGLLWEVSRGCPFACDYCFDSGGRTSVRHLPWTRLEEELELFARSGVSQIWVLDSTFNFPPRRGKELLRLILSRAPHIHFHLEGKAEFLDKEMIRLLSRIDCSVQLGLQSMHPKVLHTIGRGFDPEDFCTKTEILSAEGVIFGFDLIYGLPGDTLEGFRSSLDAALNLAPNHLDIFRLAVLPGTVLHRHRDKHGLIAQSDAPYEVIESATYSRTDLSASDLLASTTRLFYNTGRAVGFFLQLVEAAGYSSVGFIERFQQWLLTECRFDRDELLDVENWTSAQILSLQEDFIRYLFGGDDKGLQALALDLVNYHYNYAETLLGPEVLPAEPEEVRPFPLLDTPWRRHPDLRLVDFSFEIIDLLQIGNATLHEILLLLRPMGSTALFLRRGSEVACESLEDDFLSLLQGSNGKRTPHQILPDSKPAEMEQWVDFALAEGLLLPPQ
ncbi:MAG TPA: radical SAM protein [Desulfuromonadales bacterium]|nr:radical SAM protein [Desulfuromonadales bacterium]